MNEQGDGIVEWDYTKPWYHGSPERLTYIRRGSTITQDRDLARVFSHRPTLVSCYTDSEGRYRIKHSGTRPGFLYRVAENVSVEDVYPHPRTTMQPGDEWLTKRDLRVELISTTTVVPEESFTPQESEELRRRMGLKRTQ
jgi:hypothetical protein